MMRTHTAAVLVIGATGRIGSLVVDELLRKSVPVRADPESADIRVGVDVVSDDLTVPESLNTAQAGVSAVFLVWIAPAVRPMRLLASPGIPNASFYLSAPHQTPHRSFSGRIPWRRSIRNWSV